MRIGGLVLKIVSMCLEKMGLGIGGRSCGAFGASLAKGSFVDG